MEICAFYFFWFGDIDKLTAGVPNPNYLKQNKTKWMECVDGLNIDAGTGFDELKKLQYSTIGVTGMPR